MVFPDAELKIFMTADPKVRACRRYDELRAKGDNIFTTTSVIALHSATECLPEIESLVPGGSHGAYSVCAAVLVS